LLQLLVDCCFFPHCRFGTATDAVAVVVAAVTVAAVIVTITVAIAVVTAVVVAAINIKSFTTTPVASADTIIAAFSAAAYC
jgi:hypothetical protein